MVSKHHVPGLVLGRPRRLDEAVAHQHLDAVQDVVGVAAEERLGRRQGAAAGEDAQPPEQRLVLGVEEVVTPGDGLPHRALPCGQIPGAASQQR